jgi:phospholipase/carboxylesterase
VLFEGIEQLFKVGKQDLQSAMMGVMKAMRKCCRAQETIFPLCTREERVHRYFLDAEARAVEGDSDVMEPVEKGEAIYHVGCGEKPYARGGLSVYLPRCPSNSPLPAVVALHGGYGHGRDFLWTWLREARSWPFILIAPSSLGSTWNLIDPEDDLAHIKECMKHVGEKSSLDPDRVMVTGISDGGTFALVCCQQEETPFSAFAPVSGVLHPVAPDTTRGRQVCWVHGALDWMFPVSRAEMGSEILRQSGCAVTLRIIENLSHTYPREENQNILEWWGVSRTRVERTSG